MLNIEGRRVFIRILEMQNTCKGTLSNSCSAREVTGKLSIFACVNIKGTLSKTIGQMTMYGCNALTTVAMLTASKNYLLPFGLPAVDDG